MQATFNDPKRHLDYTDLRLAYSTKIGSLDTVDGNNKADYELLPPKLPLWVEFPGLSAQGQFLTRRGRDNTRTRTVPAGSSRF